MTDALQAQTRLHIKVSGVVQGVGFRPHVYRLAKLYNLHGFVKNTGEGVEIAVEGGPEYLRLFLDSLKHEPPPRAQIRTVSEEILPPEGCSGFFIHHSEPAENRSVLISPDLSICPSCREEIQNPADRRYGYPFTNCTNCGPRFTIVSDIPYDRKHTTMGAFEMCPTCRAEYDDPETRRFHAQPNACQECGPSLVLRDPQGVRVECREPISETARLLSMGKIVALKGIGGFHLACDATNEEAVKTLRARKHREFRPFALMAANLEEIGRHAEVAPAEAELLSHPGNPIVLLTRKEIGLATEVAPGQKTLGFMLPYSPLHVLLLREFKGVLVMTSGNISDEPIAIRNDEARQRLKSVADYFLEHDRDILVRCDDSVTRVAGGRPLILRRSRGYVPLPVEVGQNFSIPVLAVGGEKKNTFCFGIGEKAFLSPHIGDLENGETLAAFESGIEHYRKILGVEPGLLVCDAHPNYLSTRYAEKSLSLPLIKVQHHHAHVVSCMADNGISGPVIGIAFDGTGFGDDGTVWGGEFLIADERQSRRVGHLLQVPLPGGENAIREPWRMAFSWLSETWGNDLVGLDTPVLKRISKADFQFLHQMVRNRIGSPLTSSVGRLFDGVAALCGLGDRNCYEGQAAIALETVSEAGFDTPFPFEVVKGIPEHPLILDFRPTIREIVRAQMDGVAVAEIGGRFHHTLACAAVDLCKETRARSGLNRVVLSGGVFQNMVLLGILRARLLEAGFEPYCHSRVPPGDGGISLGQAVIGNAQYRGQRE